MGSSSRFDQITLAISALLLGFIAVIVVLMLSSCSTPPAPQSPIATPAPAAKSAVGAVTDELLLAQATKTYTKAFNVQWSGGGIGPLAVVSEGQVTTTLWLDVKLNKNGATVFYSSIKGGQVAPDTPGEGQFDRLVASYNAPPGQYQLYTRIRWELVATSTIFDDSTGQPITSPVIGYYQNDDGTIAARDSEGFSKWGDVTIPHVYYCPIIMKNAR